MLVTYEVKERHLYLTFSANARNLKDFNVDAESSYWKSLIEIKLLRSVDADSCQSQLRSAFCVTISRKPNISETVFNSYTQRFIKGLHFMGRARLGNENFIQNILKTLFRCETTSVCFTEGCYAVHAP